MKTLKGTILAAVVCFSAIFGADGVNVPRISRIFREAQVTRGNTNILKLQPIDKAAWLWMPGEIGFSRVKTSLWDADRGGKIVPEDIVFLKFRNAFNVSEDDGPLVLDVSKAPGDSPPTAMSQSHPAPQPTSACSMRE